MIASVHLFGYIVFSAETHKLERSIMKKKKALLENVVVLIIVGILAGVAGGSAVGIITGRTTSTTPTSH